jgi:hypothetical protein
VRLRRVPNWEEMVGEVWAFALASFFDPHTPGVFRMNVKRKRLREKDVGSC